MRMDETRNGILNLSTAGQEGKIGLAWPSVHDLEDRECFSSNMENCTRIQYCIQSGSDMFASLTHPAPLHYAVQY